MAGKVRDKQTKRKQTWELRFNRELSAEYKLITPITGESHSRVKVQHIPCGYIRDTETRRLFTQQCPICRKRSSLERRTSKWLDKHHLIYQREVRLDGCRRDRPLMFDFVVFNYSHIVCAIEINGKEHYQRGQSWGGDRSMKMQRERDEIKRKYCKENNISLLVIDYTEDIESELENYFENGKVLPAG